MPCSKSTKVESCHRQRWISSRLTKLIGMLDQEGEHSERLWLELQQPPGFAQFT